MSFTPWATGNQVGNEVGPAFIPDGKEISGIEVKEKAGFGITDARLHFRNKDGTAAGETQVTGWLTNNNDLDWIKSVFIGNDKLVIGLQVDEVAGYGVVDVRLVYKNKNGVGENTPFSQWVTMNPQIDWLRETLVPGTGSAFGLQGREAAGYGIVDLRLVYNDA